MKSKSIQRSICLFLVFAASCVMLSCTKKVVEEQIVARIGETHFTFVELKNAIPDDLSTEDSAEFAYNLIQNWMTRELMYDKARYNLLQEQTEIENQIERYRKDLFIYEYEKELVRQKLDTIVKDDEIEKFYNENQDIFQLNDYILKVRYIKLLPNSPDLKKLEDWMIGQKEGSMSKLEDYCHRYAVKCFYDSNWVYFNELLRELPIEVYNKESFLRTGKFVKFDDADHNYMLYIVDLQSKNTLSPLELERDRIVNLILNKRKIELLNTIRRSLYRDAAASGKAEIYDKPQIPK